MSFQAYLDNVEKKTGKTPNDFIAEAKAKKLADAKSILAWLKKDYDLGTGHARAVSYVILHGADFEFKHRTGTPRDESGTLRLDGMASRSTSTSRTRGTRSR